MDYSYANHSIVTSLKAIIVSDEDDLYIDNISSTIMNYISELVACNGKAKTNILKDFISPNKSTVTDLKKKDVKYIKRYIINEDNGHIAFICLGELGDYNLKLTIARCSLFLKAVAKQKQFECVFGICSNLQYWVFIKYCLKDNKVSVSMAIPLFKNSKIHENYDKEGLDRLGEAMAAIVYGS